ncbi:hypothetical protein ETU09_09040 [Apibacter muscae]|uniref:PLD phosphodiesterase domain-containing protein n=1 Tax=Apibacter muscae TaxID=2509004 RepID=A0A563D9F5_9FLAO|nr:AAA domain-containing protein [Apibacter muscae]TWP26699.1 hypothetical protein ETU09_09040 [Apibacter muscae]
MEHYKKITKYWRDSLVDKQFSKGKYKLSDLAKKFLLNNRSSFFRINSKNILQSLFLFEDGTIDTLYVPFSFKKVTSHSKHEKDYCPEVIFPIIFKVQVSENGFIYPTGNPIIPRDLLLPLDKEDFYIGNMDDYDLFTTQYNVPSFEFEKNSEWEVYFLKNIESEYREGLISCLFEQNLIDSDQSKEDFKKLIKSLSKSKASKKEFTSIFNRYNEDWDILIEDKLANDKEFNKSIESYLTKWHEYFKYVERLLDRVITSNEILEGYEKIVSAYFTNGELDISSKITAVYEDLYTRKEELQLNLLRNYTTIEQENETSIIDSDTFFSKRLGHNNDKYPLTDAQRTAVSALLDEKNGEILAVNGPPGTGKTTMLLSIVACLWVESAIKASEPPVIIANSTNNQAVTNIIDSFAKDFSTGKGDFSGRWMDGINSFGSYFVSSMRGLNAREKGYLTEEVVKEMETEGFYVTAKKSFLEKSKKAFNLREITVEESVNKLHSLLLEKKSLLSNIEEAYRNYHNFGKEFSILLNIDYKNEEEITVLGKTLNQDKKEIEVIEKKWEKYLASESIFLSLFSFLPFVKQKRNYKAKVFANENNFKHHLQIENMDVNKLQSNIQSKKEHIYANNQKYKKFTEVWNNCKIVLNKLDNDICPNLNFIEIDKKADTKIRFEMFLIATHYWEGRWLLEMEKMIDKGHLKNIDWKYKNIRENNWKRRMKITPCAVMTSYMLPSYFSFSRKIHDNLIKEDYLYDFIDLLIVDEAGQVSPEVAGAGFSLAKKALVIGDTLQIPPISKLTKSIDIGNLHKVNLISKDLKVDEIDKTYKKLQTVGIASDGGSVMKISQNRSKYYPEKKLERGLYLYEHRRCYDSIIRFCNELCYKGILKPMRGDAPDNALLPSMGYLNIEGKCQNAHGSKKNELEAKIIAGWIISNYKNLREAYNGKEIKDIIAVVTPFREQSYRIAEYLRSPKDKSLKEELSLITVGTVHSLQGAEREVILFSPTYSRDNKGGFIDNDRSMLNVAVSRAKDSFLVFGDMSLFNRESVSPTGILSKYLFESENNELSYIHQYSKLFVREDLISKKHALEILTNYEEHDVFLKKIFSEATQRIIIISPWLIYSTIEENGYDQLLLNKSIKVTIYVDEKFNTHTQNKLDKEKEHVFHSTINKLNELGVEVKVVNNIHSKIVIKDDDCLCIGSFNWFSAQRGGKYANTEHSIAYYGENTKDEINSILKELN